MRRRCFDKPCPICGTRSACYHRPVEPVPKSHFFKQRSCKRDCANRDVNSCNVIPSRFDETRCPFYRKEMKDGEYHPKKEEIFQNGKEFEEAPCKICGMMINPILHGDRLCDGCWEVTSRFDSFIENREGFDYVKKTLEGRGIQLIEKKKASH